MKMPGIDVDEIIKQLGEINPSVKIILTSGFSADEKIQSLLEQGVKAFLQKPFVLDEMARTIAQVIERE